MIGPVGTAKPDVDAAGAGTFGAATADAAEAGTLGAAVDGLVITGGDAAAAALAAAFADRAAAGRGETLESARVVF